MLETQSSSSPRKSRGWREIIELAQSLVMGVVLALILQIFIQPTIVYGESMEPSLHNQERVIVDKVSYRIGMPARGDIVIFPVEGEPLPLIKRVIGLPGDTVEVHNGQVLVNGVALCEPYVSGPTAGNMAQVKIPEDTVFVMGDNRAPGGSLDSRRLGPISLNKLMGRARLAIWPLNSIGLLNSTALPAQ